MAQTADISIWDAESRAVLVQSVSVVLPIKIGRIGAEGIGLIEDANGQRTEFGKGFGTLSRDHMHVAPDGAGGALVTDSSSNGIARIVPGQPPMHLGQNRKEELKPGSMRQFETVGLIIEVALPRLSRLVGGAKLYATYDSRSSGKTRSLPLGPDCIVVREAGGSVEIERRKAASVTDAMARVDRGSCLAILGPDGAGGTAVLPGRTGAVISNRRALKAEATETLDHLDTVEIGPLTLRVLAEGAGDALICVNPECRQMNDHNPGGNCRYCGTRLGDAVTRMLPTEAGQ